MLSWLAQEFTMAKVHSAFIVGVALLAAMQEPVAAQLVVGSASKTSLVPPGKDPFRNIAFGTRPMRRPVASPKGRDTIGRLADDARPRIVCGMTVVPVTPDIDPKMVLPPKPESKVDYKIRVVSSRLCGE